MNHPKSRALRGKRVERIWRREGLKVPKKQPKRGRLWLNDGSTIRLRPERKDHVWSYDFIHDRTRDGGPLKILSIVDEYTRECLALKVGRSLRSSDVIDALNDLFIRRGVPEHVRSDNGPEFTAEAVRSWLKTLEIEPLFIEPGSPWEDGYPVGTTTSSGRPGVESSHGKFRDELLNRELVDTLWEAHILLEGWPREYNTIRPHSALGYRPPAPEAMATRGAHLAAVADKPLGASPLLSCQQLDSVTQ